MRNAHFVLFLMIAGLFAALPWIAFAQSAKP